MKTKTIKLLILASVGLISTALLVFRSQATNPAPEEDRVGFPKGYATDYTLLFVFDRPDNRQVRVVYGNDMAASANPGEPFPYGSILAMETHRARVDEDGHVILDEQSRFQRDELTGIFVMRKEKGFGEAYEHNRTGEWEYVAYRPDGSYLTPPRQSASCARCHLQASSPKDWVFRASLFFNQASGALPNSLMQHYLFVPDTIHVPAGTAVTWYNDDEVEHRIALTDGGFDSGNMRQGTSFGHTFDKPGRYDYQCTIHPTMRGAVIVTDTKTNH